MILSSCHMVKSQNSRSIWSPGKRASIERALAAPKMSDMIAIMKRLMDDDLRREKKAGRLGGRFHPSRSFCRTLLRRARLAGLVPGQGSIMSSISLPTP